MAEGVEVFNLCPECQRKKKEEEQEQPKEGKKEDKFEAVKKALRRAEGCRFFKQHTLFDAHGQPDPLIGKRTCSLTVKARCGHEVPKHNLCMDWIEGKSCKDWETTEEK